VRHKGSYSVFSFIDRLRRESLVRMRSGSQAMDFPERAPGGVRLTFCEVCQGFAWQLSGSRFFRHPKSRMPRNNRKREVISDRVPECLMSNDEE
jgi:hypothetical protein